MKKLSLLCLRNSLIVGFLFLCKTETLYAQSYALKGVVVNEKLEPLPYINIRVKELQRGARTNSLGEFAIMLPPGRYEIVISGVGHKTLNSIVLIRKSEVMKRFVLEQSKKEIKRVVISTKRKDRSKEIIRQLIANKKNLQKGTESYSFEAYIKSTAEDQKRKKKKPNKIKKTKKDSSKKDSNKTKPPTKEFAEVYLEVSRSYPDKIKETRTGVNIKGNKENFFYLSFTEGDFNFYDNIFQNRALGKSSFLSPFSNSGLLVYRYKYKEQLYENGAMYHRIQFRPSRTSNSLLRGEVLIQDKTWAIKKIEASFPSHLTPEYKKFTIKATYDLVKKTAWLPSSYLFTYLTSARKSGETNVQFSKYKIDTVFKKKHFSTELSSTTLQAYERDSNFWKMTRPVPLSPEEIKIIRYKDSLFEITNSDLYRDSVEKENNKIRFWNIVWKGSSYENWRKERFMVFPSLVQLWNPVALGGPRYGGWFRYKKTFKNKKQLFLSPKLNYGPINKDIRGNITGSYLFNPFRRSSFDFTVGRDVSNIFWGDAFVNFLSRSNYFMNETATLGLRHEITNGLYISNRFNIGLRKNLNSLKINNLLDSVFFNRPIERPRYFDNYNAFSNEIMLSYTPEQKYIREPYEKVILGSRFPTFYAKWRKGIPKIIKSTISYDYIELGATQEINMGTLGLTRYNIKYGNFVREKNIEIVDYKFIARGNPGFFVNPLNSFQAMDSTFSLFKGFLEAHHVHEFNGAFINKIPYVRKLKIFESAGGGFLIAPERNLRYIEAFAGLEKRITVFRQPIRLGLWGVASYANQFKNPLQLKFSIRFYNFQLDRWQ